MKLTHVHVKKKVCAHIILYALRYSACMTKCRGEGGRGCPKRDIQRDRNWVTECARLSERQIVCACVYVCPNDCMLMDVQTNRVTLSLSTQFSNKVHNSRPTNIISNSHAAWITAVTDVAEACMLAVVGAHPLFTVRPTVILGASVITKVCCKSETCIHNKKTGA